MSILFDEIVSSNEQLIFIIYSVLYSVCNDCLKFLNYVLLKVVSY